MKNGTEVVWDIRRGHQRERRAGVVVYVREDGHTDDDMEAALRDAGWTGAVRTLRWRRHRGQLPDVVVRAPWTNGPGFFAPGLEELVTREAWENPVVEAWAEQVVETSAKPEMPVEPDLPVEPELLVEVPARARAVSSFARSWRSLAGIASRPRLLVGLPPVAEHDSVVLRRETPMTDPSAEPEPAASPAQPSEAASKESVARALRRLLDGHIRTRDELYQLVQPLFILPEHRFRGLFQRALDRMIAERTVVREWKETPGGPVWGYLGINT